MNNEEILRRTIHDMILNQCRYIVKLWLKHQSKTHSMYEYHVRTAHAIEQFLSSFELYDDVNKEKVFDKIYELYNTNYKFDVWSKFYASDFNDVNNKLAMQMIDMLGGNLYDWFTAYILQTSNI